jgi:hypothetical protein
MNPRKRKESIKEKKKTSIRTKADQWVREMSSLSYSHKDKRGEEKY